jgi:transcriptional regulator with XRE-family HTH domain
VLRAARERAGFSQRELAKRAKTSPAAISFYESGDRIPGVDTLARLIGATGSTLEISAPEPPVDLVANGETLRELLGLADNLPQRADRILRAPVLAKAAHG